MWFNLLWQNIYPVVSALMEFFSVAFEGVFGLSSASSALTLFGNIMSGILIVVNWFTTGLIGVINFLEPFAPLLLTVAVAWGVLNAAIAISPIGWIVIGIVALITVIGMAIKYTSGWGESWIALKKVFEIVWSQIKMSFDHGVQSFKTGFNLIILHAQDAAQTIVGIFSKVSDAISMAKDGDFSGAFSKVSEKVKTQASGEIEKLKAEQKQQNIDYIKQSRKNAGDLMKASSGIGISVDTDGISKDFKKLKDSFKGAKGEKTGNSSDYLNAIPGLNGLGKPKDDGTGTGSDKKGKKKGDGITDGGNKLTNITININKLQDQTIINVDKTETGLSNLGDKVQEILLRAANSILQMQTG